MRGAVTEERLLRAWEATLDEQWVRRAVALLAVCRDAATDDVSGWGLAERDAALFDLRCALFGAEATAVTECPECGEELEARFDASALRPVPQDGEPALVTVDGYTVRTRWPTTEDLAAATETGEEPAALAMLVARCVEAVRAPAGTEARFAEVPPAVVDAVHRRLSDLVAAVDAELSLSCAGCGATFPMSFDIGAFLIREVEGWAARVLREIHLLARAYGWDEPAILRLSPRRRRAYLDLIEAAT